MAKSIQPTYNILENARPVLKFHQWFGEEIFDMSMSVAMMLKTVLD